MAQTLDIQPLLPSSSLLNFFHNNILFFAVNVHGSHTYRPSLVKLCWCKYGSKGQRMYNVSVKPYLGRCAQIADEVRQSNYSRFFGLPWLFFRFSVQSVARGNQLAIDKIAVCFAEFWTTTGWMNSWFLWPIDFFSELVLGITLHECHDHLPSLVKLCWCSSCHRTSWRNHNLRPYLKRIVELRDLFLEGFLFSSEIQH